MEGEFHFALPLRLLGAVLLVPPLLGSGEVFFFSADATGVLFVENS